MLDIALPGPLLPATDLPQAQSALRRCSARVRAHRRQFPRDLDEAWAHRDGSFACASLAALSRFPPGFLAAVAALGERQADREQTLAMKPDPTGSCFASPRIGIRLP